jgi:hypothetical protein
MPIKETFLLAEPESKSAKQSRKNEPAQKLLDWLQRWSKDTVCVRDIRIFGPKSIRDGKKGIAAAEVLTLRGWLVPLKKWRYDMHKWQIVRKPIAHPTVTAETTE